MPASAAVRDVRGASGGTVRARTGAAAVAPDLVPDLVLAGHPQLILALLTGKLTAAQAARRGLEITGDESVLRRVLPGVLPGPAHGVAP